MTQATVHEGIDELQRRRTVASGLGGPDRVQRQHDRGLLTALERMEMLLDPGTIVPFAPLVHSGFPGEEDRTIGDGMLMGFGRIDGRWVASSAPISARCIAASGPPSPSRGRARAGPGVGTDGR